MRTYIKIDKNLREEMTGHYGITARGLRKVLYFLSNSKLAIDARRYALDHGGVMVREEFVPNCETASTQSRIVHTFVNGVLVIINLDSSAAEIKKDGKVVRKEKNLTLQGWGNLLYEAQLMAAR